MFFRQFFGLFYRLFCQIYKFFGKNPKAGDLWDYLALCIAVGCGLGWIAPPPGASTHRGLAPMLVTAIDKNTPKRSLKQSKDLSLEHLEGTEAYPALEPRPLKRGAKAQEGALVASQAAVADALPKGDTSAAGPQATTKPGLAGQASHSDIPLDFRCDTMKVASRAHKVVCLKDVVVQRGPLWLCCQKFIGHGREDGSWERLECLNDVRVWREGDLAWGDKADYLLDASLLKLRGRAVIRRADGHLVRGREIWAHTDTDEVEVYGPQGMLQPASASGDDAQEASSKPISPAERMLEKLHLWAEQRRVVAATLAADILQPMPKRCPLPDVAILAAKR